MGHSAEADERFEVLGNELRSVVTDDSWRDTRMFLQRSLANNLDIHLRHRFSKIKVNDVPTTPVKHGNQVVERPADVDVGDVDMPVRMRFFRLLIR